MIKLNSQELHALEPILTRLSTRLSRQVDIFHLFDRWEEFVRDVEKGYSLTGYDYVDDLAVRDLIGEVISAAPPMIRDKILKEGLDGLDQRFRVATRELPRPLRLATPERPGWWWLRAPNDVSGDFAKDLLANDTLK